MSSLKPAKYPRLGFLGVGWIGRHRMEAIARSGIAEIAAIADLSAHSAAEASRLAPAALRLGSLEELLETELDGMVIATPSALHARQAITALERGMAVFCQKPLARTAQETHSVIQAAHKADVLLGLDFSYRCITGIRRIQQLCRSGALGDIYAVELVFHNAYGPDKPWFYDWQQSGGGCVMDLGIHLVDLALWSLDFPKVEKTAARLFSRGQTVTGRANTVEDYAVARLDLETGASVQLTCSWKLPVGCDAIISGAFYGTKGGAAFRNRNGSFYSFIAEQFEGTKRIILADAEEEWGGRAAVNWARRLAAGAAFDPEAKRIGAVAEVLDSIYECAGVRHGSGPAAGSTQRLEAGRALPADVVI